MTPSVLTPAEVDQAINEQHLEWEQRDGELHKSVKCRGFTGALAFVNVVGDVAERAGHHPDVDIRWDTVTLHLVTHSAGGITAADLSLASVIDSLEVPPG